MNKKVWYELRFGYKDDFPDVFESLHQVETQKRRMERWLKIDNKRPEDRTENEKIFHSLEAELGFYFEASELKIFVCSEREIIC